MPAPEPDGPRDAPLRIMVVDDHDLFRNGLRRLLEEEGFEVVADASRGAEAVEKAAALRPSVVVMDVNMPGMSGVEAARGVRRASAGTAVLMLTVTHDKDAVLDAVLAGASGYLLKDATLQEICRGVRAAAEGNSLIAPEVAGDLLGRLRDHGAPEEPTATGPELTPREHEVLQFVVAGLDNGEIAKRLHVSPSTVKHHVSATLTKLGVDNRIQAAVLAVRLGLVDR